MAHIELSENAKKYLNSLCLELPTRIAHTAGDRPEQIDPERLVNLALALKELVLDLDGRLS
jgi:hypothetical protein